MERLANHVWSNAPKLRAWRALHSANARAISTSAGRMQSDADAGGQEQPQGGEGGEEGEGGTKRKNERVERLANEMLSLSLLELYDVTEVISQRIGVPIEALYATPAAGGMGGGAGAAQPQQDQGGGGEQGQEEQAAQQQTFTVKLDAFDEASKIKVIKEVRAAAELGLKEAKELVGALPATVKTGVGKEDADALKQKLEQAGATVSVS